MSATLAPVVGDGTTATSRATQRWRRARWTVLVLASVGLVVAALAVTRPPAVDTPHAPDSTGPTGSRAVAQVLGRQGVEVMHVTTVDDAVRAAAPGTTLLVVPSPLLDAEQARVLAELPADLVLMAPGGTLLDAATDGRVDLAPVPAQGLRPADCALDAAQAAGEAELAATFVARNTDVTRCWVSPGDPEPLAALVQVEAGGRTVTAVGDPAFLENRSVIDQGNAALALHLLGGNDRLVWLVQDLDDASAGTDVGPGAGVVPSWLGPVGLWALLCAVVGAVWRGRRLGPLVAEELPVVVPAAEATRGRGRLYRRARSRGHASTALRAASADRMAARVGVPRSADPTTLVDVLARATGRHPQTIIDLLYGPPPADDAALSALADRLDDLESEVHRL